MNYEKQERKRLKMKKRFISMMLILGLCFTTACGGGQTESSKVAADAEGSSQTESEEAALEREEATEEATETEGVYVLSKVTIEDNQGVVFSVYEYHYDDKGNLLSADKSNKYGETDSSVVKEEYDEHGNRVVYDETYTTAEDTYQLHIESEYEYDADGKVLLEKSHDDLDGTSYTRYEYDEEGKLVRKERGSIYDDTYVLSSYDIYEYDENGVLKKETMYDEDDAFTCAAEYNENGEKIKTKFEYAEIVFEYEYDENGLVLKSLSYTNGELEDIKEKIYDENGNVITETYYDADGNIKNITKYEYIMVNSAE